MKKRKFTSDEENLADEPEEGECSGSENDGISDEIIPDMTSSESDNEEQGFFYYSCIFIEYFLNVLCVICIFPYCLSVMTDKRL